jgi:thiamine pyrophosphate-dependent acetolactate synthase large subunit-like protein
MNGGEIIAKVLKKQDVQFLFTLCGGHISPILVGAKKQGLRVIDVRQEPTAVFAADAVSRLTGIPGVAAVTAGPGVTNSITAIKNAQMAQSPLILLGGAAATILKGRGALQDIEQIKLFQSLVKWAISIKQDCDIVPILEEAFDVAKSGIPGPVFVECPIDLLYDEDLVREWYGAKTTQPTSLKGKLIKWYVRRHVDKLFACSPKNIELSKSGNNLSFKLNETEIKEVLTQINNAQKPIMVIGSQALLRVDAINELVDSVKKIGIPVFLTGMARGLLGQDNILHKMYKRSNALRKSDLILIAGMPIDFRLGYGRIINRKAFLITINRNENHFKKNIKPDLSIHADPSQFLIELSKSGILKHKEWKEWFFTLNKAETERINEIKQFSELKTNYINPLKLSFEINKILDNNSIIIGDGGDFIATISYIVKPRGPLSWLDAGPFGTLGAGAGFALASKLVRPDAEVWLLYGDGAAGYSIVEFDTFVRHKIPIIAVIGNDAGWTQIARDQIEYLKDDVGTLLTYNDYHIVAEGYGGKGLLLCEEEKIQYTLRKAKELVNEGYPILINALLGKTDFRKGSISM